MDPAEVGVNLVWDDCVVPNSFRSGIDKINIDYIWYNILFLNASLIFSICKYKNVYVIGEGR